jgi:hypothetical protein
MTYIVFRRLAFTKNANGNPHKGWARAIPIFISDAQAAANKPVLSISFDILENVNPSPINSPTNPFNNNTQRQ